MANPLKLVALLTSRAARGTKYCRQEFTDGAARENRPVCAVGPGPRLPYIWSCWPPEEPPLSQKLIKAKAELVRGE